MSNWRNSSIESMARTSLIWMVVWRILGEFLVGGIRRFFGFLCEAVMELERSIFYLELDAARKYKALTGFDPGFSSGQPARYAGLDVARVDAIQRRMMGNPELMGEDES